MPTPELLRKYARLIVRAGLSVQPGQPVQISAQLSAAPLVEAVAAESYAAGSGEVEVVWSSPVLTRLRLENLTPDQLSAPPAWQITQRNDMAEKGGAVLQIDSGSCRVLSGVDPAKIAVSTRAIRSACRPFYDAMDAGKIQWCIVGCPDAGWAKDLFPDLPEAEGIEKLWELITPILRLDADDPLAAWEAHRASFDRRVQKLNALQLDSLHYSAPSTGTDLTLGLPKNHVWIGGGGYLHDSPVYFFPNMPTEEIFTSPDRLRTNGYVRASMPLSYNGSLIDGFWFRFENGRVTDFGAETGLETLRQMLQLDEGMHFLGECALVPMDSPIARINTLFYKTLFDENASCHLALGDGMSECVQGGLEMTPEQLLAAGVNSSLSHTDFMFGTPDLSITGRTSDGKVIPIMQNGLFIGELA